jgi:hypothetical protein
MDFSLSSSLVGGAVLNPDRLSLDLQFAADKSLTARKGPTPVFTRASTATFVGSNGLIQSAAVNAARFDHDPVTLASKGLLIEESRTNLVTYSNDLALAFVPERASILADNATSPDGTTTADKLVEDTTASNSHRLTRQFNLSAIPYTFSVFAKASERSWIRMTLFDGITGRQVWFDVSAGVIGTQSGAIGQIVSFGNGWWRCSITATGVAFISSQANIALATADNISTYTGDGTSGLFLWGAQIEAGSFATSYIPTVASSVVRSADVCSITGSAFSGFYNQSEGSLATSVIFNAPVSTLTGQIVLDVNDTTVSNRTRFIRNASTGFLAYANTVGGTQDVAITGSTVMNAGAVTKLAGCMKANDFTIYLNNVSQGVDTVAIMQSAPTTFTIGDVSSGSGTRAPINGTISSIRYFKKRLPNAKLQALTV